MDCVGSQSTQQRMSSGTRVSTRTQPPQSIPVHLSASKINSERRQNDGLQLSGHSQMKNTQGSSTMPSRYSIAQ